MKRPYRLKQRAEAQARTRQKIVDAAIELHQSKGIAGTTVGDIAARAKVGKVTVYRHFPDELSLVTACSGKYFQQHPMPDIEAWLRIGPASDRLRQGLRDVYRFHRETEAMMTQVLAEARDLPIMEPYDAHWRRAVEILAEPWSATGSDENLLKAALALALTFDTWRLLVRTRKLTEDEAIALMMRLVSETGPAGR